MPANVIMELRTACAARFALPAAAAASLAFFTVAAYSNKKEREIFEDWTLLGTTILHKKEWLTLFKLLNYKGDYYFTTSNSLNLK